MPDAPAIDWSEYPRARDSLFSVLARIQARIAAQQIEEVAHEP